MDKFFAKVAEKNKSNCLSVYLYYIHYYYSAKKYYLDFKKWPKLQVRVHKVKRKIF